MVDMTFIRHTLDMVDDIYSVDMTFIRHTLDMVDMTFRHSLYVFY